MFRSPSALEQIAVLKLYHIPKALEKGVMKYIISIAHSLFLFYSLLKSIYKSVLLQFMISSF